MRYRLTHQVAFGLLALSIGLPSIGLPSLLAQGAGLPGFGEKAGQQQAENVPIALEGNCAVCLMRGHRWVKGKPEHSAIYDGRRYFFPSENEKRAFLNAPSQFAPVLNGDSVVADAESGQRVPGNIRHAKSYKGRLYLFQSEAEQRRFTENPEKYAQLDLAYGGRCAVCKRNGGNVLGKPQFAARYHGIRYLFPSARQQEQFLAEPDKYSVQGESITTAAPAGASCPSCGTKDCKACQNKGGAPPKGVTVRGTQQVSVRGKTACASCKYGVPPLGAKETLGLAIETNDGKVYIVEDADRLYPKIYEGRFQNLPVELKGQVLQTNGKFAWVKPTSVIIVR